MATLNDIKFLIWYEVNNALRSLGATECDYVKMFPPTDYDVALEELDREYPGMDKEVV